MAEPILKATTTEADALLVEIRGDPQIAGTVIVREWTDLDATAVDSLYTTLLAAATVTDPKADNQSYTGTFVHSGVNPRSDAQRHGAIRQTLTKVTTLTSTFTSLSGLTKRRLHATDLEHPFTSASVYDPATDTEVRDVETYRFENIDPASYDTILAYTVANWESLAPSGYAYDGKKIDRKEDNTLFVDVRFRLITSKDVAVASYTSRAEGVVSGSTTGTEKETEQIWHEQGDDTPPTSAPATGATTIVEVRREDGGKFTKALRIITHIAQSVAQHFTSETLEEKIQRQSGRNLADADITSTYTVTDEAPAEGVTTEISKEKTPAGLWNASKTVRTAIASSIASFIRGRTLERKTQEQGGKNLASATVTSDYTLADSDPAEGVLVEIDKDKNPDGTWNATKRTLTAIASSITVFLKVRDRLSKTQEQSGKNLSSATVTSDYTNADSENAQGVVVEVEKDKNPDGTWNAVKRTMTAIQQTLAAHWARWDFAAKVQRVEDRNLTDAQFTAGSYAISGQQTAGVTVTLDKSLNRDGTINVRQDTTTSLDQTATAAGTPNKSDQHSESFLETVDVERHTAAAASEGDVAAAQGVVTELENEPRPDGKYQTAKTIKTAVEQLNFVASHTAEIDKEKTVAVTKHRNLRDANVPAAPTQADGTVKRMRKDRRPDGSYDVDLETATYTADALSVTAFTAVKTKDRTETLTLYRNAASQPTLTEDFGTLHAVKNTLGYWDGEKRVITYTDTNAVEGFDYTSSATDLVHWMYRRNGGINQKRSITYTLTWTQTTSRTGAYGAISGGLVGTAAGSSRVEIAGWGQYRAVKITLKSATDWVADGAV